MSKTLDFTEGTAALYFILPKLHRHSLFCRMTGLGCQVSLNFICSFHCYDSAMPTTINNQDMVKISHIMVPVLESITPGICNLHKEKYWNQFELFYA